MDFAIKDCALANIATGRRAQTLREMRNILRDMHPGSIYHHFWGTLLRPQSSDREFNNDFASWSSASLHDNRMAERLAVIDPMDFSDLEGLRQEIIEVIDERLDETEVVLFARADQQFHFVRSAIVVFDTHRRLAQPEELAAALPKMSVGSIFYHFIDARRRTEGGVDDFRAWLTGLGPNYADLCSVLAESDPYFDSLYSMRERLSQLFESYFAPAVASEEFPGGQSPDARRNTWRTSLPFGMPSRTTVVPATAAPASVDSPERAGAVEPAQRRAATVAGEAPADAPPNGKSEA